MNKGCHSESLFRSTPVLSTWWRKSSTYKHPDEGTQATFLLHSLSQRMLCVYGFLHCVYSVPWLKGDIRKPYTCIIVLHVGSVELMFRKPISFYSHLLRMGNLDCVGKMRATSHVDLYKRLTNIQLLTWWVDCAKSNCTCQTIVHAQDSNAINI